jgi:hypothetical protein
VTTCRLPVGWDIERGEHRITLNKLEMILNSLKVKLKDVFPEEY